MIRFDGNLTAQTMSTNRILVLILSISLFASLSGCTKTGPAGPIGVTGSTGPAGPQGPSGPSGANGPQGNANVLVDTFTLVNTQWVLSGGYEFYTAVGAVTVYPARTYLAKFNAVTQSILNTGEVLVYFTPMDISGSYYANQWLPLPFQFADFTTTNFDYDISYQTLLGNVLLFFFFEPKIPNATLPSLSTYNIATYKFKIVAVSGTISTGMKQAGVNTANYTDVSKYLGL
jgi:hypothetical protein